MALPPYCVWLCVQQPFNTVNTSNLIGLSGKGGWGVSFYARLYQPRLQQLIHQHLKSWRTQVLALPSHSQSSVYLWCDGGFVSLVLYFFVLSRNCDPMGLSSHPPYAFASLPVGSDNKTVHITGFPILPSLPWHLGCRLLTAPSRICVLCPSRAFILIYKTGSLGWWLPSKKHDGATICYTSIKTIRDQ